jgi:putative membrane protein
MRYVVWTIRLIIFVAVLFFAYKNVTPVDVVLYDGMVLANIPLIVVILLAFLGGAAVGAVLMVPGRVKRWRESGRLRKDLARAQTTMSTDGNALAAEAGQANRSGTSPL